jgi:hypothetical protein
MFRHIRDRLKELEEERIARLEQLRGLETEEQERNGHAQAVELLEALPVLPAGVLEAPQAILRLIFEWFQLQVRYDKQSNLAHVRVAISEDTLDRVLTEGASVWARGRGFGERTWRALTVPMPTITATKIGGGSRWRAAHRRRATSCGGHVAVREAVVAQFASLAGGDALRSFDRLGRRRNEIEYPAGDSGVDSDEVDEALNRAEGIVAYAEKVIDTLPIF